ncbi:MAG: hypothetical protein NWR72_11395 [Bacteroidia bacterium]|nr:hypothetical protein [Bacteroidia bacterium]
MKMTARYIPLFIYLVFPFFLFAQTDNLPTTKEFLAPSDAIIFGPEQPLVLDVALDMKSIFRKKNDEDYLNAIMRIRSTGGEVTRSVGVKARGDFRRSYCAIPPLKIKLKNADFGYEAWDTVASLKLVTTCKSSDIFEDYLMKEYLAYKMYSALTPRSFMVRLVQITFKDINGKYDDVEQMGFLIEDIDDLAKRNQAFELEPEVMSISWADRHQALQMILFQYAIGNTDWHVGNLHNLKVIKTDDPARSLSYLIPYDFDFSGLVNAPYAIPDPELMIPDVQTRVFQGSCYSDVEIMICIHEILAVKDIWMQEISASPWLSANSKRASLDYMKAFFDLIENDRAVDATFFMNCYTSQND